MIEQGNVRAIREFMIKSVKRYMMDMDLMRNVIIQNEYAFENKDDILQQFNILTNNFKAVLDCNFYPAEIKDIEDRELD